MSEVSTNEPCSSVPGVVASCPRWPGSLHSHGREPGSSRQSLRFLRSGTWPLNFKQEKEKGDDCVYAASRCSCSLLSAPLPSIYRAASAALKSLSVRTCSMGPGHILILVYLQGHIRCKLTPSCKPCKLQSGPPDQHSRSRRFGNFTLNCPP